ncbi:MAG: hypothetical protein E5Y79_28625 [Mesorhizobium sp.]|nr:MAG: hypothetical protein E5Y79_28625 [Mesorhizobium sp.]TIL84759.1 MAG: hypothetical protein E5Y73_31710 [Mesorhizobium sp.]
MQQQWPCCKVGGTAKLPISPLVGEMSGRTEGGQGSPSSRYLLTNRELTLRCSCKNLKAGGTTPPSALPGISPTRGEIGSVAVLARAHGGSSNRDVTTSWQNRFLLLLLWEKESLTAAAVS